MFQIERTVGASHLNSDGTLSLASIVNFMQDCCCFQLDSEEELSEYFRREQITMFLISRQINIRRPAEYGDRLTVRTSIYQLRPAHGFRNTLIYNQNGDLLVSSYAGGAFIHIPEAKAVAVPKELLKTVPIDPKFDGMEYLPRKIHLPKDGGTCCGEQKIPRFYIDHNQHVNNAKYFDIAEEYLPEDFHSRTARIEYKTAAKAGDTVIPVRYDLGSGRILISLQGNRGEIFANAEFYNKEMTAAE